jgi:hypothetical protein
LLANFCPFAAICRSYLSRMLSKIGFSRVLNRLPSLRRPPLAALCGPGISAVSQGQPLQMNRNV